MNSYQTLASPSSVIVTSRDKRRIGLKPESLRGKPLLVPGNMKSTPINQYAGLWMRDSKGKGKQDYKFIERVLEFTQAQVSYFCNFFKIEQEGVTQIIRFVSCIKDDELAMKVNGLINYIKSWPDPNQVPRPIHQKQQKSVYSLRNEAKNSENVKRNSFFSSTTTSPSDSLNINNNNDSSNSYSESSTPIYSQVNSSAPFYLSSPNNMTLNNPMNSGLNNSYMLIRNDIRYSEIKEITRILINGTTEITFNFPQNGQHFFLNLLNNNNNVNFNSMRTPPLIRWPISLQISINDFIIKAAGTELNTNFIDVSELMPKTLKFISQCPTDQIVVSILSANYRNYEQIIENAKIIDINNFEYNSNLSNSPMMLNQMNSGPPINCLFCPITGKLMKFPGRGINCQHKQCFDIKTFLKISNRIGHSFCPICQKKIELNELAISKASLDVIERIRAELLPNTSSPSLVTSSFEDVPNINEMEKEDDNNSDVKVIGLANDDFELSNDQIFNDPSEPFSFELNNMPFSSEY